MHLGGLKNWREIMQKPGAKTKNTTKTHIHLEASRIQHVWQDFQFEFYSQRLRKDQGEVAPQDISQQVSMGSNMVIFLKPWVVFFFSLGGLLFWEVSVVPVEGRD